MKLLEVRGAGVVRRKYEGEMGGDQTKASLEVVRRLVQRSLSAQWAVFDRYQDWRLWT